MIYIGKIIPGTMEKTSDKSILEFFQSYEPLEIEMPSEKEEQNHLKTKVLDSFISGEMKEMVRTNENVISRDCLVLDLDDVLVTESELLAAIHRKFEKFQYIAYPSLSHGVKGVRYRLILPLSESVTERDYKLLIQYMNIKVFENLIGKADESNGVWSQAMLLPVVTQYIQEDSLVINEAEYKLPVENLLEGAKAWYKIYKPPFYPTTYYFRNGGTRYRNRTTELFESLTMGCSEGNRNNRIAQITGGLLARAVNVKEAYKLVLVANQHFDEPLSIQEVEHTFYSIAERELSDD